MPLVPEFPGFPNVTSTFVQGVDGKDEERQTLTWWSVLEARRRGWSVWWVDSKNDLQMENRWLNLALDEEVPLARLADADKNGLPGHHLIDFARQPVEQTQQWWRHLLLEKEGREPTEDEYLSWRWKWEGNDQKLELFRDCDARQNKHVSSVAFSQNEDGLGHVLPEVLMGQQHMLWIASHYGGHETLGAWMGWLLEQHRSQPSAPPVWIVMNHGNLSPVTEQHWWSDLEVGRAQLLYDSTISLLRRGRRTADDLPAYLKRLQQAWDVAGNRSGNRVMIHKLLTDQPERWSLPRQPFPALKRASWPTFPSWRAVFKHHRLVEALEQSRAETTRPPRF